MSETEKLRNNGRTDAMKAGAYIHREPHDDRKLTGTERQKTIVATAVDDLTQRADEIAAKVGTNPEYVRDVLTRVQGVNWTTMLVPYEEVSDIEDPDEREDEFLRLIDDRIAEYSEA